MMLLYNLYMYKVFPITIVLFISIMTHLYTECNIWKRYIKYKMCIAINIDLQFIVLDRPRPLI